MINPGDIISYLEMCVEEGVNLQRGMNYHLRGDISVILMSLRRNAPYADKIEEDGRILVYEGHDVSRTADTPAPKTVDQPMLNPGGTFSQNGLFYESANRYRSGKRTAELVKVYEKIHRGIWAYNGVFRLIDAWQEESNKRKVFKFKLELVEDAHPFPEAKQKMIEIEHNRIIPPQVKLAVWKRDRGRCVVCGRTDNLHFDHIIPFSKGGSSLVVENIQLLCAQHNIAKGDKIE